MRVVYLDNKWGDYRGMPSEYLPFLRKGVESAGDNFSLFDRKRKSPADLIISWNAAPSRECLLHAPRHLVMEAGHLGNRKENFSFCFNELGSYGSPLRPESQLPGIGEKWYPLIQDTSDKEPKNMVIMGQCPEDRSMYALGFSGIGNRKEDSKGRLGVYLNWVKGMATYWESKGMNVRYKTHPFMGNKEKFELALSRSGIKSFRCSMGEAIDWADAATAICSTALVECFLAGLFVVPTHSLAMTWPVRSSYGKWRQPTLLEKQEWLDWVSLRHVTAKEFEKEWGTLRENI